MGLDLFRYFFVFILFILWTQAFKLWWLFFILFHFFVVRTQHNQVLLAMMTLWAFPVTPTVFYYLITEDSNFFFLTVQ
jgi:hypothetical protein